MKTRLLALALLVPLVIGASRCSAGEAVSPEAQLDISAVTQLLDVLDLLVRKNPGYKTTISRLSQMPHDSAESELQRLAQKNGDDPEIKSAIDGLLGSPTYKLYYRQFRNVTPEIHRKILCALPYWGINSPADIGGTLRELCLNLDSVRSWVTAVVSHIDLDKSQRVALEWLPPGDYPPPPIRFLYDGNGGAFANDGEVGFDLYGSILGSRAPAARFANLAGLDVNQIELIIAHELQHIYAARYLYPPGRTFATWQDKWIDRLTRNIVSEGVAMQCNVGPGVRRSLMEDTVIVRYWISQFNGKVAAMRNNSITESQIGAWYDSSLQDVPRRLLIEYWQRVTHDQDSVTFMQRYIGDRPAMAYTLGWWMLGRILERDSNREKVIALLSDPSAIFKAYNESIPADTQLRVEF
ncbi:MAG: hypothetical protein HZB43_10945 [candidate division Zixibacteria bacterium]|nr:hypothetical protein [candidate division Zixibacteria bacterium]